MTFGACAARAAMLFLPAVAGISAVIVDSKFHPAAHYVVFCQVCVGAEELDSVICALFDCFPHGIDEFRAAVGINGVVARMVGEHQRGKFPALGKPGGHSQHYPVAERHHCGTHVFVVIVSRRDCVGPAKKRAFEMFADESERYLDVFDSEVVAMPTRTFGFTFVVVRPVHECDSERYPRVIFI